ncbi:MULTISPECIES: carboxymuconolactone decarboxylase family protein [Paenibacillus]|uniref:AhpD-like protein n=1 Tax=Paenibacillus naphthalenovorans TaxID=162209 RepID=A0A0U2N2A8_9BACL|nr:MULTISPECIES: carboxymuconolactone decarboxylase family protein [Paenibacillus]ALS25279.1 AhpD-like protein [Paenibacillus naphthalenovorans]GCL73389.1 carboxymuconolactone decarboxylase family protein [Paenibacillus naphthalenovorans]SDI30378.1 4-carboxymuconolactone decarboxylase [Paenibacillus naphthalenovorans]
MADERYEQGLEVLKEMTGGKEFPPLEAIHSFYPGFAEFIVSNGFADIYSRPGLDIKQRELITLSSLITQGAVDQLDFHIHAALNVGLSPKEIVELVLHCSAYAGFPKAIAALGVVMRIFKEREVQI